MSGSVLETVWFKEQAIGGWKEIMITSNELLDTTYRELVKCEL